MVPLMLRTIGMELIKIFKGFGGKKDSMLDVIKMSLSKKAKIDSEIEKIQARIDSGPFAGYLIIVYNEPHIWIGDDLGLQLITSDLKYRNRVKAYYTVAQELFDLVDEAKYRLRIWS